MATIGNSARNDLKCAVKNLTEVMQNLTESQIHSVRAPLKENAHLNDAHRKISEARLIINRVYKANYGVWP